MWRRIGRNELTTGELAVGTIGLLDARPSPLLNPPSKIIQDIRVQFEDDISQLHVAVRYRQRSSRHSARRLGAGSSGQAVSDVDDATNRLAILSLQVGWHRGSCSLRAGNLNAHDQLHRRVGGLPRPREQCFNDVRHGSIGSRVDIPLMTQSAPQREVRLRSVVSGHGKDPELSKERWDLHCAAIRVPQVSPAWIVERYHSSLRDSAPNGWSVCRGRCDRRQHRLVGRRPMGEGRRPAPASPIPCGARGCLQSIALCRRITPESVGRIDAVASESKPSAIKVLLGQCETAGLPTCPWIRSKRVSLRSEVAHTAYVVEHDARHKLHDHKLPRLNSPRIDLFPDLAHFKFYGHVVARLAGSVVDQHLGSNPVVPAYHWSTGQNRSGAGHRPPAQPILGVRCPSSAVRCRCPRSATRSFVGRRPPPCALSNSAIDSPPDA